METCRVKGLILAPNGRSFMSAEARFRMTRIDKDGGLIILPEEVITPIKQDGSIDVNLWPNSRGYAGTYYILTIEVKNISIGRSLYGSNKELRVVVPDLSDVLLADILEMAPPPPVDESRQQVILAREARDEARGYRDTAGEHAEQTGKDAEATSEDRRQTGEDRAAVEGVVSNVSEAQRVIREISDAIAADAQQVAEDKETVTQNAEQVVRDLSAAAEHAKNTREDREATKADAQSTAQDRQSVANNARQTGEDREATNADAGATAEDRLQTGRDAQATAADRRQTGEDRSAVADDKRVTTENREATTADALATKADAEATAADKRQTGEDRTATGQDRTVAAAAAASAVAATLVRYGCTIFKTDGIDAGGYYVEQRVFKPSKQTVIYAEMLNGDPGAEAVVTLQVNGVAVNVPIVVKPGAPITLTGLNVNLVAADKVRFIVAPTPGKVRELFLATYGAVA